MAFFKKTDTNTVSRMPSELIQVLRYEGNEIIAKRLKDDTEVTVAFAPMEKAGNHARPEVAHFTGRVKKPRDMTAPAGSILKVDRSKITEDLTNGKMMISWATAWSRDPELEMVFKATSSITYLKEKEGVVREDGTKSYQGRLAVLMDDNFAEYADGRLAEQLWKGEVPTLVESGQGLRERVQTLLEKGLAAGVRMSGEGEEGFEVDAVVVYPKHNEAAEKVASEFMAAVSDEFVEQIGKSIQCEVIPAYGLAIGNDTAAALHSGVNSDGKPSPFEYVRQSFQGKIKSGDKERDIPAFKPALIKVHLRKSADQVPYLSVENIHPFWVREPALGMKNAILKAGTENSAYFSLKNDEPAASNSAEQKPAAPAASAEPAAPVASAEPAAPAKESQPAPAPDDMMNAFQEEAFGDGGMGDEDWSDLFNDPEQEEGGSSAPRMRA